jgi:hypothetical protein
MANVRAIDPDEVVWFAQEAGALVQKTVENDGIYRSGAFPGPWLDPDALSEGDFRRRRAVIEQGYATPEHAAFIGRLAANCKSS